MCLGMSTALSCVSTLPSRAEPRAPHFPAGACVEERGEGSSSCCLPGEEGVLPVRAAAVSSAKLQRRYFSPRGVGAKPRAGHENGTAR